MKRIGIMGGTFDPVHKGHLIMAQIAQEEFALDDVLFVITGDPPHKKCSAAGIHRLAMLRQATEGEFSLSTIEMERQGKTYAIDTLRELGQTFPGSNLIYVIGADTVLELMTWKSAPEVFQMTGFIAVNRPGVDEARVEKECGRLSRAYGAHIDIAAQSGLDVSSTSARKRAAQGLPLQPLLIDRTIEYIQKNRLYLDDAIPYSEAMEMVREALDEKRFRHTLGVIEAAKALALHYGEDQMTALWAALLHDVAKRIPHGEALKMMDEYGLPYDKSASPKILHSFLGSAIAKRRYMIDDKDILNAIEYHTTGRPAMSRLEKIIYIADFIEEGREFDELAQLRRLAFTSLDAAMAVGLELTVGYVSTDRQPLCNLTALALEYYQNLRKVESD